MVNVWKDEWNSLPPSEQARLKARQGVPYPGEEDLAVMDPLTMQPVPADGETMGEVMFRGNIGMKGYLKNPKATEEAFAGGWFHSGDLGVMHPDGYVQLKDRSKDIIISGGENISSIEVEDALYKHPAVGLVAVVARPDPNGASTLRLHRAARRRERDGGRGHRLRPRPSRKLQAAAHRDLLRPAQDLDGQDPEVRAPGAGEGL